MTPGRASAYTPPPLWRSALRLAALAAAFLLLALTIHAALDWLMRLTEAMEPEAGRRLRLGVVVAMLLAYALLIAVPFVPGIEIGLSLMLLRGAEIAPWIYLATLAGLSLAYLAGRFLPHAWLHRLFLDLRLTRACRLLDRVQPLTPDDRLTLLRQRLPGRLGAWAVGYRYLLLAGLINLPGSGLIGGGGGIAMLAGLTRVFRPLPSLVTLALAVLPLPLLVWLFGPELFESGLFESGLFA